VLSERGLGVALEWLAGQMLRQHRLKVAVEAEVSAEPEAADLRVFLFRAVRELLLNAVKHAGGSPVRLSLSRGEGATVQVVVADQGPGFEPAALGTRPFGTGGIGLATLRERATALGGELRIDSAPGRGARLTLQVPIRARARAANP
jgi:signal transduction histidine kinase